jgi:hypothetical protein
MVPMHRDLNDGFKTALQVVDDVVLKNYITKLSQMDVVPLGKVTKQSNIQENVRFFKITEIVYQKEELATHKFASVYNALASSESTIFVIIDSDGKKTDFYMGVRNLDPCRTTSSMKNTVENAMRGQFPGIKTVDYTIEEMEEILSDIKANSISSVSCVANNREQNINSNQNFVQGLEKLVLSMQGEKYTGIILANGTTQEQLHELRKEYEKIYTQLSAYATMQVNYSSNNSVNNSIAETRGESQTISHTNNESKSEGQTTTDGTSKTHGESKENVTGKVIKGLAGAATIVGSIVAGPIGGLVAGGGVNMLGGAVSGTVSDSTTSNHSVSQSNTRTIGTSDTESNATNFSATRTEGRTKGVSEGMTLTLHDKSVENILERINRQLKRIDEFESLGMYECAAYFLSENQYAAEVAAATYKSIMRGENSGVEVTAINSWGQEQPGKTRLLEEYIKNFIHPVFKFKGCMGSVEVTPCSMVSGNELAIHMGLPRKSVCGLPVIEHADFGKEIVMYEGKETSSEINLGKIFNMGETLENRVFLDVNSLAMHTFVTGSTGSGKSNTIYELLRQLDNIGVSYMIIEPAKGEYKNIFGNFSDVKVLGTNPQYTELLRINPFKFPKEIHVLEHIDRLVEIFNVCWPMYAAMPAVLKDTLLQAYQVCGWDLVKSSNRYSKQLFPTFSDLLSELEKVIYKSAYSDEVKGNYIGSLATRIRSLTNGLNGQIFSAQEIDNNELFDKKVIIDLSRIGSLETKSLIMGILIMRLNEHRVSNAKQMNVPLKHITVLEEAHNILKQTSTSQDSEKSNVAGKSVEMIANAIAEMRTYGEGFIIVDQSPDAVDESAIKNTNTKIIMRLPDEHDRCIVGKSVGLKNEQLDEISKLPKGVAVVYQNDWVEPVLCKIKKYKGEERLYRYSTQESTNNFSKNPKLVLIQNLLKKLDGDVLDLNSKEMTDMLVTMDIPSSVKKDCLKLFNYTTINLEMLQGVLYELVATPDMEMEAEKVESIEEWKNVFISGNELDLSCFSDTVQNTILECILREQIVRFEKPKEYLDTWQEYVEGRVL